MSDMYISDNIFRIVRGLVGVLDRYIHFTILGFVIPESAIVLG